MADLTNRLARGESAAFAELYDACAEQLYGYLVFHLRSSADAEDVVHETFARLARAPRALRRVENLTAYVFTIARNEAARLKKRQARYHRVLKQHAPASESAAAGAMFEAVDAIRTAVDRLPLEQREVVELKAYGGLTLHEIAATTALPVGTVATRYRAALKNLRDWFVRNECHE